LTHKINHHNHPGLPVKCWKCENKYPRFTYSLKWTMSNCSPLSMMLTMAFCKSINFKMNFFNLPIYWQFVGLFIFLNCFIIHMCIQGLGHFFPVPPPPPYHPLRFISLPLNISLKNVFEHFS
jgi:hypothetical protein